MSVTIAIVDDDDSVRAAVSSLVRSLGFDVLAFASAETFLASPRLGAADCLISDVQMPGMTGPELQAELAAASRHIPVIFITGFPEDSIRRRVEAAGAFGFLAKPFDSRAMIDCIEAALAGRGCELR